MNRYVKHSDNNNKYIIFIVHDKELLQKYEETWHKISNLLKKGLIVCQSIMIKIVFKVIKY